VIFHINPSIYGWGADAPEVDASGIVSQRKLSGNLHVPLKTGNQ
jgi:hypothetical protein